MRSLIRYYRILLLLLLNSAALLAGVFIGIFAGRKHGLPAAALGMSLWAKAACAVMNVKICRSGSSTIPPGSLVVANHCSYLDILVLGSIAPGVFVAKKEIGSWHIIGWLSRLAGTIFVDRSSRKSASMATDEIKDVLSSGTSVLLFPEGTTSNGREVLPFRSSFFKVSAGGACAVVPVSLSYSYLNGTVLPGDSMDAVAWYGDMSFLPHAWNILGTGSITVEAHVHPEIRVHAASESSASRKDLASLSHAYVKSWCEPLCPHGERDAVFSSCVAGGIES